MIGKEIKPSIPFHSIQPTKQPVTKLSFRVRETWNRRVSERAKERERERYQRTTTTTTTTTITTAAANTTTMAGCK